MKKIFGIIGAFFALTASVPLLAAFEKQVINVTAEIGESLSINTSPLEFGTVFPQQEKDDFITIALSDTFIGEGSVDDIEYVIRQKPKCGLEVPDSDPVAYSDFAQVSENEAGEFICPAGYQMLPLLCPYLSKHDHDPEDGNDGNIDAFHGVISGWDLQTTIDTEVSGYLAKSDSDFTDVWKIDLKTPCFEERCDQGWPAYVHNINPDADPNVFIQPAENHLKLFGCDLWIEVTGISENPSGGPETFCGDGIQQDINDEEQLEQCDGDDGVGPHQQCSENCLLENLTYCGDDIVQNPNEEGGSEQCDGTAGVGPNQSCSETCQIVNLPFCGNGVIDPNEQCDGTEGVGPNQTCSDSCQLVDLPFCGNGVVDDSEQCDGTTGVGPNETCSDSCQIVPNCGNGQVDLGEQCDGLEGVGEHEQCIDTCLIRELTFCGDGTQQTPNDEASGGPADDGVEECDGADGVGAHQECSDTCELTELTYCGDGTVQSPNDEGTGGPDNNGVEQCDGQDGLIQGFQCDSQCILEPIPSLTFCGDGIKQTPNQSASGGPNDDGYEQCDGTDGVTEGFHCTQSCELEEDTLACSEKVDVMLVLDRSGSIDSGELSTLKTAANDFVDTLFPETDGVHIGQVSFSTTATLDVHLTSNATTLHTAINSLSASGLTNLEGALIFTRNELANPGDGHDRIDGTSADYAILITDGAPTTTKTGGDPEIKAAAAAAAAKADGITIYVVGVGTDDDTDDYLRDVIATSPDHYFDAASYNDLSDILSGIAQCEL